MPALLDRHAAPVRQELSWLARACRAPKLRTHEEFYEQEIWLTTGPFANRRARINRQPWTRHWLGQLNRRKWVHRNMTGCGQGGKSLLGLVEPLCYHLFEIRETVVFGVLDTDMADDKWKIDFLPIIEKSRYRDFLPVRGEGSEKGKLRNMITFTNGARLKVMSGGGSDNTRSGFTSRIAIVTEVNKLAKALETGNETSRLNQILSRVRSHDLNYQIYTEGTQEVKDSPVAVYHRTGTESRLIKACPHCGMWVSPDQADFVGWKEAPDVVTAMETAHFSCPECHEPISEEERRAMNAGCELIMRGQRIVELPLGQTTQERIFQRLDERYVILGDEPRTLTFSFRFSAFDNQLASTRGIAKEEWDAAQESNQEVAQKKISQFLWANPYKSPNVDTIRLEVKKLIVRQGKGGRGFVPAWCERLVVGADLRKRQLHYVVIAFREGFTGQVIDQDFFSVRGDSMKIDDAIKEALLELRERCEAGWRWQGIDRLRVPDAVWFDSRYGKQGCYAFVKDPRTDRSRYRPIEGVGLSDYFSRKKYVRPDAKRGLVTFIGDDYHLEKRPADKVIVAELGTDSWKTRVHESLAIPAYAEGSADLAVGAVVFFETQDPNQHLWLARHLCSERQEIVYEPGEGLQRVWVHESGESHGLDATYIAFAAAHHSGIRTIATSQPPPPNDEPEEPQPRLITPSGMPYYVGDRRD